MALDLHHNRRNLDFLLYHLLDVEALTRRPAFAEHDRTTFGGVLDLAAELAERDFAVCARELDEAEPFIGEDGRVVTPPALRRALRSYASEGFLVAAHDAERGGMGLPFAVFQAVFSIFTAANTGACGYLLLTQAAANLLAAFGSEGQRRRFLAPMLEGRFFGTMCLSEPQAGSSLADVRTRALPLGDGRYCISGTKMWITGGEHELSENIVHLVLARIEGAPAGVKGISLFVVPRYRVDEAGEVGDANDVRLVGLNHKMGYRGSVNTVLAFGDEGACEGELVGAPGAGLATMFHMMNEARVVVGLGAAALAVAGYRHAVAYARERPQGRLPGAKDPAVPQVPIVEHPDVKRMLLAQKALAEGALCLALFAARLVDDARTAEGDAERVEARRLLDLPVVKAWNSQAGLAANDLAIQVHGGYGYTRDFPVERFWRDNRLNPIHEGTNGIQALDLLGRKVGQEDGAGLAALVGRIDAERERAASARSPDLGAWAYALGRATDRLIRVTGALRARTGRDALGALANASAYADLFGHVVVAWLWLWQARVALEWAGDAGPDDFAFGKLQACRYFYAWELPRIEHWATLLERGDAVCQGTAAAWL